MSRADISAFEQASGHQSPRCGIAKLYRDMTPVQVDQLCEAFAAETVSNAGIVTVLGEWGIAVSLRIVQTHRSKGCSCGK